MNDHWTWVFVFRQGWICLFIILEMKSLIESCKQNRLQIRICKCSGSRVICMLGLIYYCLNIKVTYLVNRYETSFNLIRYMKEKYIICNHLIIKVIFVGIIKDSVSITFFHFESPDTTVNAFILFRWPGKCLINLYIV